MFRSFLAAICAVVISFRYRQRLGIQPAELFRYFLKSFNLGLCYGAFVRPLSFRGCIGSGKSAFLCCAYDVASDWRDFSEEAREILRGIFDEISPRNETAIAFDLYSKEITNSLKDDGLERGVFALRFITGLAGSRKSFEGFGLQKLGMLLQLVDDILDFEDDVARSEMNCLRTRRRGDHLRFFVEQSRSLIHIFQRDPIMKFTIRLSKKKALRMLSEFR